MSDTTFLRAIGEQLHELRGSNVCMLGRLNNNSASDESSFEIITPDNKTVLCKLKFPIRDTLSDIIEVYGTVDEKGNINCQNYATFEQSAIENFDMDLYKETIQMMYQLPKHYIQKN